MENFLAAATDPFAGEVICMLDALDECKFDSRRELIERVSKFYHSPSERHSRQSCLKLLITSRPYDEIERPLHNLISQFPHIHIAGEEENNKIGAEIDLVCRSYISSLSAELKLGQDVKRLLERKLHATKQRTYLWLHLVIDEIRRSLKRTEKI